MDVGPLVIPHAQAAKLAQPGKCALDDPPPPAQATPVLGAAHRQPGHDVPRPETAPNRRGVVAAITQHTVRTPPRPAAFALEQWNRIHQRQGFLRVVPVRAGQAHRERHAPTVAYQMALAPAFGSVGGIGAGLLAPRHSAHGATIHDRSRPINPAFSSEPIQQREVHQIPNADLLPIAQAPPARHPRSAPEFLREHLPGDAAAKDEDNACEARAIRNARPSALWQWWGDWQERFDKIPQRIWKQRGGHACSRYLADGDQGSEVLLHALSLLIDRTTSVHVHERAQPHSAADQRGEELLTMVASA